MGKIKDMVNSLYDGIIKLAKLSDLDYKFDVKQGLPNLAKLKEKHSDLMQSYVIVIAGVNKLSYFVNTYEVYKSKRRPAVGRFLVYLINKFSIYRLASVKTIVKLLVETHIVKKLQELENIYIQLDVALPLKKKKRSEYSKWLKIARDECRELSKTLHFTETIKGFALSVINFLTVTGAIAIAVKPFSTPSGLGWGAIILMFVSIFFSSFVDNSFQTKRDIFLGPKENGEGGIYSLENELFDLLNRRKDTEFPIDYLSSGLLFFPVLIVMRLAFDVSNLYIYLGLLIMYAIMIIFFTLKRNKSRMV